MHPVEPVSSAYMQKYTSIPLGPYFWGAAHASGEIKPFPNQSGNIEARKLIGDECMHACSKVIDEAVAAL